MTATLAGINDWVIKLFFGQAADSTMASGPGGADALFLYIWWVSVFFFVLLMGIMFYCMVVYRRKEGSVPIRSASHNTPLEIAWSVIPSLLLAVMFFWGFDGYLKASMAPSYAEEVSVTAQKWSWTMEYSSGIGASEFHVLGGNDNTPIFYMPADTPVRLKMHSADVLHAFWVPDFRMKLDIVPNRYTPFVFNALPLDRADVRVELGSDKQGNEFYYRDHTVFCAEYCGDSHSEMVATLRVVDPSYYKTWVETPPYDEITPPVEVGALVWKAKCAVCHTIDGGVSTGPTWLNSYGYPRDFADGSALTQQQIDDKGPTEWDDYIRRSILTPGVEVRSGFANAMSSFDGQISDVELRGVIEYMRSLSDRDPQSPIEGFDDLEAKAAVLEAAAGE
jgi:cytochrome c oxidase subunit 2